METDLAVKIPPPPRRLTRASRRRLSREARITAWGMLISLGVLSVAYAGFIGFMGAFGDLALELRHSTADGSVRSVWGGRGDEPETYVSYVFKVPDGREIEGRSYTAQATWPADLLRGHTVTVQYLPDKPSVSRIKGMRRSFVSWNRWLILPPYWLLGLLAVVFLAAVYVRRRRLCESGVAVAGEVLAPSGLVRAFDWKLATRAPWRWGLLRYRYHDREGVEHVGRMKTGKHTGPLKPGDLVTVIYDESLPRRSIALEVYDLDFEEAGPAQAGGAQ